VGFFKFLLILGGMLLGGLILNLMPCVLPVIALKIFGFTQQAGQDPRRGLAPPGRRRRGPAREMTHA
jgi:thiol:disulfide interchange protein